MITLISAKNNSSVQKMKNWFILHGLEFQEVSISSNPQDLRREQVIQMLGLCEMVLVIFYPRGKDCLSI